MKNLTENTPFSNVNSNAANVNKMSATHKNAEGLML